MVLLAVIPRRCCLDRSILAAGSGLTYDALCLSLVGIYIKLDSV